MVVENTEIAAKVQEEKIKAQIEADEVEAKWQVKIAGHVIEKEKVDKEIIALKLKLDTALRDANRQKLLADSRNVEDPEKEKLRDKIKEQAEQMKQIEAG